MAKFYVKSGSFRGIVDAADPEMAAVWAVQRVMQSEPSRTDTGVDRASDRDDLNPEQGLFRLGDSIAVSERGFGRRDRIRIPTRDAFLRWVQLAWAIERMIANAPRQT